MIENSVVSTPANGQALFSLSKSIKSFFDNLQDNQKSMKDEKMTAEEIANAPVVELEGEELAKAQEETEAMDAEEAKEVSEGTNPETLEDVETAGESLAEAETEEVAPQEVEANDETNEEKTFTDVKAMKQELSEVKASLSEMKDTHASLIEALELSTKTIVELKGIVAKIPTRKGFTTL